MKTKTLLFVLVAFVFAAPAWAQDPNEMLPVDPNVQIGTLDNGITFYIRENKKPENRAELRLVVNAGSILEEDDQQGLAHFLEHMAFNGTESFEANDIIDFLESIGVRFGPDLNAYTSFDETVYMLEVPTDKEGLLDKGLMVLSEWASKITLDEDETVKERGVVLEEWRLGKGADDRIFRTHLPVMLKDSKYAERLPIGTPEVIEGATSDQLRAYYEKWYQPDLMAVVAVGDFAAGDVEAMIREHFEGIEKPASPTERPEFDVPDHDEMLASVATDAEETNTSVSITYKHANLPQGTVGTYRKMIAAGLFSSMLNARLREITQKPDPPFLFAAAGAGSFARSTDMFSATAITREGEAESGLAALITELTRARVHGFGEAELERAKARFISGMERAYNERDKTENASYIREYVSNFLEDEPIPGIEVEFELGKKLMEVITLDEIDAITRRAIHDKSTVIEVSAPDKPNVLVPDEAALLAAAAAAAAATPDPYVDELAGSALLADMPKAGTVVERGEVEELGITTLTLSNGVELWVKPTDFKNDEIVFAASLPGGQSLVDEADFISASVAATIVGQSGVGGHSTTDLQKLLSGKQVRVGPQIGLFTTGVSGSSTPSDLETALQLVYLNMTAPNHDVDAFTVLMEKFRVSVENRLADPDARYADRIELINYSNHYAFQPWTVERVGRIDQDKALEFYEQMMKPTALRFYFVGAIDLDTFVPLAEQYLGAIPLTDGDPPAYRALDLHFPEGVTDETVRAGIEPKARTRITWPAITNLEEMEMFNLRTAIEIFQIRLREVLREELSETYGAGAGYRDMSPFPGYATTVVTYGCAPENVDNLKQTVFSEIERFKSEGPTEEEIAKIKEIKTRDLETALEQNGYWLGSLVWLDLYGWDPLRILARQERIDNVTAETMQDVFSRYFPKDNYTIVTLLPENESGEAR